MPLVGSHIVFQIKSNNHMPLDIILQFFFQTCQLSLLICCLMSESFGDKYFITIICFTY